MVDRPDSPDALPFVRARTPEQRDDRLAQLVQVTRRLLADVRAGEVTLGAIAAAAGIAKSGVLRYAGSREALLLLVMYQEHREWLDELRTATGAVRGEPAQQLAHTLACRPVLCDLISASPVLMSRLSPDEAATVRAQGRDISERLRAVLEPQLSLDAKQLELLTAALHAFAGTVWGWAVPASDGASVAELEGTLAALLHTFIAGLR